MIFASILHGAYGDYYEQAVCLKSLRFNHPDTRIKLFAANAHRLTELRVLDFSWAECFEVFTDIANHKFDKFFQFQAQDRELRSDVLSKLPGTVLEQWNCQENLIPWQYLRPILPLSSERQLSLSDLGRSRLSQVMQENGISADTFQKPTIGFLWRYRSSEGAIRGNGRDPLCLVEKYSRLFRRVIDAYGCHILVCGMKVARTQENMHRIDAKYPAYGLDLPAELSTHLKGLSWALELEMLSRCTLCVANPSGFSEALWIRRGGGVLLVDPGLHYLAKAVRHRVPLFNLHHPKPLLSALASRWEDACFSSIRSELDSLLRPGCNAMRNLQNLAS